MELFVWLSISYWTDIAYNINLLNNIQSLFDAFQKLRVVFLNSHNEADMQEPCVSSQQGASARPWEADVLSQSFSHVPPITKCFGWDGVIFLLEECDLVLDRPDAAVFPKYNSTTKVSGRLTRIMIYRCGTHGWILGGYSLSGLRWSRILQIVLGLFLDSIKEKKIDAWKANPCYAQRKRTGGHFLLGKAISSGMPSLHGRMIDIRDV